MNILAPDLLRVSLFTLNTLLVLLDASLGYHLAPRLLRLPDAEESELRERTIRAVRRFLGGLVALYMFFNCLGYFRGNNVLLLIVTALVVSDLGGQLYLGRSSKRDEGQP